MHAKIIALATTAALLTPASALAATSFSGDVSGQGIESSYTVKAKGKKKACITQNSNTGAPIEEIFFKIKKEELVNERPFKKTYCAKAADFVKAMKKANSIKAVGESSYGEIAKGKLRKD